jgi:hypothetical protein
MTIMNFVLASISLFSRYRFLFPEWRIDKLSHPLQSTNTFIIKIRNKKRKENQNTSHFLKCIIHIKLYFLWSCCWFRHEFHSYPGILYILKRVGWDSNLNTTALTAQKPSWFIVVMHGVHIRGVNMNSLLYINCTVQYID